MLCCSYYIMANIIGFAVFAPLEHPNPDFVTLHAVQQVVCTGTFLLMDSVPSSRRFKLIHGTWLLAYWCSLYYGISDYAFPWAPAPLYIAVDWFAEPGLVVPRHS